LVKSSLEFKLLIAMN